MATRSSAGDQRSKAKQQQEKKTRNETMAVPRAPLDDPKRTRVRVWSVADSIQNAQYRIRDQNRTEFMIRLPSNNHKNKPKQKWLGMTALRCACGADCLFSDRNDCISDERGQTQCSLLFEPAAENFIKITSFIGCTNKGPKLNGIA